MTGAEERRGLSLVLFGFETFAFHGTANGSLKSMAMSGIRLVGSTGDIEPFSVLPQGMYCFPFTGSYLWLLSVNALGCISPDYEPSRSLLGSTFGVCVRQCRYPAATLGTLHIDEVTNSAG